MDPEFEDLHFPNRNSHWDFCMDNVNFNIAILEPHPYTGYTHITSDYSKTRERIRGPLWLDIWKAFDRLYMKESHLMGDHRFIEEVSTLNYPKNTLLIGTGS